MSEEEKTIKDLMALIKLLHNSLRIILELPSNGHCRSVQADMRAIAREALIASGGELSEQKKSAEKNRL